MAYAGGKNNISKISYAGIPASYATMGYDGLAAKLGGYNGGAGVCPRCGFGGYQGMSLAGARYGVSQDPALAKIMSNFYKEIGEYYGKIAKGGK